MNRTIIHLIIAARPNIMKIAPLYRALAATDWAQPVLVHTGQHYDDAMSGAFLRNFDLPVPDHQLEIGSGTYAEQTGRTMMAYEALCLSHRPDLCVVAGDVNATIACAFAAKKQGIAVAHLEAGLRSFDRTMPEEINRLATDAISDWFWTPSADATAQLKKEGIDAARIAEVGNLLIDAYHMVEDAIEGDAMRASLGMTRDTYGVVTFHRPANVDTPGCLQAIVSRLTQMADRLPIVFPVHPRTRWKLADAGLMDNLRDHPSIHVTAPLPYVPFMNLVTGARLVVTDSGGVQEETTYLGIPCLTLRTSTERPVTITQGTNQLVGFDALLPAVDSVLKAGKPARPNIHGWDGKAAERTVAHIRAILSDPDAIFSASSNTAA